MLSKAANCISHDLLPSIVTANPANTKDSHSNFIPCYFSKMEGCAFW